ncbi:hypothetical protein BSKO_01220 [Bryopsis sp. KO-2023]|nr:hypothetical protein BSKO_01220 [Bryopsis sp. KO-2023]
MDLGSFVQFPTRRVDLYDALASTSRDDRAYTVPERDWPAAFKVLPNGLTALPRKVVEGGNNADVVCRLGILSEVDLAWSSVDSTLYLWRLGASGNIMLERTVPGTICCVSVVKPKPNIFMENIKYVLVVCTYEEVSMVGLIFDNYGTSIEVQELTFYTCSLDGVAIQSLVGTKQGRIFMGSVEGIVYELYYSSGSGILWSNPLCRKVSINGNFLSRFLKRSDGRSIIQLLLDDHRMILYSLDDSGRIQAYDLGPKGDSFPRNFAQCTNFFAQAAKAVSGRDIFAIASDRRVVSISVIPRSESWQISLMAVTSDGHRVYFNHVRYEGGEWFAGLSPKAELKALFVRSAPQPSDMMGPGRGNSLCERDSSVFQSVSFSGGVLLAVSADNETASTEIAAYLTVSNQDEANLETAQSTGLREHLLRGAVEIEGKRKKDQTEQAEFENRSWALLGMFFWDYVVKNMYWWNLPNIAFSCNIGTAVQVVELKRSPHQEAFDFSNHGQMPWDELSAQIFSPRLRFGLVTSRCSVIFEKAWPVDVLAGMLAENNLDAIRAFFTAHGPANAAAMCFQLAASPPEGVHRDVGRAAARLLSNKFFGGEPKLVKLGGEQDGAHRGGPTRSFSGFLLETGNGSAIQGSAAFHGLKLYVVRLIELLWRDRLFKEASKGKLVVCNWSPDMIEWFGRRCQEGLAATDFLLKRWGRENFGNNVSALTSTPQQVETKEVLKARYLLKRTGDVMGLLQVLMSQNLNRIMTRLSPDIIKGFKNLKLMDMVLEENLSSSMEALITEVTSETREWSDVIINRLNVEASSFFSKNKATYLKAFRTMQAAIVENRRNHQQKVEVEDAVALMKTVPQEVNVREVADALFLAGHIESFVTVCLTVAAACGTDRPSETIIEVVEPPRFSSRKELCYEILFKAVHELLQIGNAEGRPGKWSKDLERLLQAALASKDHQFIAQLFEEFGRDTLGGSYLITMNTPDVAKFLRKKAGLDQHASVFDTMTDAQTHYVKLLAKYLSQRNQYSEAAQVYQTLADRRPADGESIVELEERLLMLNCAQNQMCCVGKGSPDIDDSIKIMELQIRLRDHFEANPDEAPDMRSSSIRTQALDVAKIVNQFAAPYKLYSFILEALTFIDDEIPPRQPRGLWQLHLKSVWEESDEDLVEVCEAVKNVGKLVSDSTICFPSGYICFLLESLILGIWPVPGGVRCPSPEAKLFVQAALFVALDGMWSKVIKAYRDCLRSELRDVRLHRSRRPPQLQLEVLKSMAAIFEQICADPFFPSDDEEKGMSGETFASFLDECLGSARDLRRSINQAEVDSLVASFQQIKRASSEKCGAGR